MIYFHSSISSKIFTYEYSRCVYCFLHQIAHTIHIPKYIYIYIYIRRALHSLTFWLLLWLLFLKFYMSTPFFFFFKKKKSEVSANFSNNKFLSAIWFLTTFFVLTFFFDPTIKHFFWTQQMGFDQTKTKTLPNISFLKTLIILFPLKLNINL